MATEITLAVQTDPIVGVEPLRVKSSSSASKLASAIAHGIYDNDKVVLRAIGAGAINQAVKAIAIATQFVAIRGLVLACRPGFVTVQMPDREVSAITFHVFTIDL